MGLFKKWFRNRKNDAQLKRAIDLEYDHKYAEAAQVYAERAKLDPDDKDDNELIFADNCISSFKDWIKAGKADEALNQARRALQGYVVGDWLKPDSDDDGENIASLREMVADLRQAGYMKESDAFLTDVNKALAKLGQPPLSTIVASAEYRFPDTCPHCGGVITYCGHLDEIPCPFCGGVVRAIGPSQ